MQLSTKARYAARAMMELAAQYGQGPTLLKDIAQKQEISDKYLEQLLAPLRSSGIIYTMRGNKGGYVLGKDPREVSLYEVVNIVEGSLAPVPCVDRPEICQRSPSCVTREVWVGLKGRIVDELKSISLAQLAAKQDAAEADIGISV